MRGTFARRYRRVRLSPVGLPRGESNGSVAWSQSSANPCAARASGRIQLARPSAGSTSGSGLLARQPGVAVDGVPFINEHSRSASAVHSAQPRRGRYPPDPRRPGAARFRLESARDALGWTGDRDHCFVDLSHFHDYATCRTKDEETTVAIERLQPQGCDDDRACGRYAIHGLLDQAQRRDLRVTALDIRTGDTRGNRDRVAGYGSFAFEYAHAAQLDVQTRQTLLCRATHPANRATKASSRSCRRTARYRASWRATRDLCDPQARR